MCLVLQSSGRDHTRKESRNGCDERLRKGHAR